MANTPLIEFKRGVHTYTITEQEGPTRIFLGTVDGAPRASGLRREEVARLLIRLHRSPVVATMGEQ